MLGKQTGAEVDRAGRVAVEPDLTLPGHPEIFVIGDMAHCKDAEGKPLPGLATVAMQQARYVARAIAARRAGKTIGPFRYKNPGTMATIGRNSAIADLGWLKLSGYLAWLAWLFVHLMKIIQFESKALILMQWCWNYATRNRSARLITGESGHPRVSDG
jgi:NADH dehydrogenase